MFLKTSMKKWRENLKRDHKKQKRNKVWGNTKKMCSNIETFYPQVSENLSLPLQSGPDKQVSQLDSTSSGEYLPLVLDIQSHQHASLWFPLSEAPKPAPAVLFHLTFTDFLSLHEITCSSILGYL